jgi:hypothetical protein
MKKSMTVPTPQTIVEGPIDRAASRGHLLLLFAASIDDAAAAVGYKQQGGWRLAIRRH